MLKTVKPNKEQISSDILNKIYTGPERDKYIYLDRRNARLVKLAYRVTAAIIAAVPVVGTLLETVAKLLGQ
jgi:hypothetical protein